MSERIVRATRQRAEEGRPHGAVLFGWRREYDTDSAGRIIGSHDLENPEQAAVVRQIVDRLLAGDPLPDAARHATRVAAFSVGRPGAQPSYPARDDELPSLR